MKKSELRELIREIVGGYEPDGKGKLVPHNDKFDSTKLNNILKGIVDRDSEKEQEAPVNEEEGALTALEIKEFVKQTLDLQDYDVSVSLNPAYNEIKLTIKQDPSEEDFNNILSYLEDNGYTIDRKQTTREGDDDGDRYYYPRIRFQ